MNDITLLDSVKHVLLILKIIGPLVICGIILLVILQLIKEKKTMTEDTTPETPDTPKPE